jgi:hypothetical protein
LVVANVVGVAVILVAMLVWYVANRAPITAAAWHSQLATWIGRGLLAAAAVASGLKIVRDSLEILS